MGVFSTINAYFLKGLIFGLLFDWEADDVKSELYLPVKESDTIAKRSVRIKARYQSREVPNSQKMRGKKNTDTKEANFFIKIYT